MIAILALLAAAQPMAAPQLEPLAFLAGHCWEGRFADGKVDTHCFEPVYDGRYLRDRHAVTGAGSTYAGETLYAWDQAAGRVIYTYWVRYSDYPLEEEKVELSGWDLIQRNEHKFYPASS